MNDWKKIGQDLVCRGYALVDLREDMAQIPQRAFDLFHNEQKTISLAEIAPNADSASCTGYHSAGGLSSRYNEFREGWVFSNKADLPSVRLEELQELIHSISLKGLKALESELDTQLVENLGPFEDCSQWHVKQYVVPEKRDTKVWLNSHTDPSLISVVILDRPGSQPGALGLCRWDSGIKDWVELERSGHSTAILLTGSVLKYLFPERIQACRHCVQYNPAITARSAITLFVRPRPDALLVGSRTDTASKTFAEWNQRVARRYGKNPTQPTGP